MQACEHFWRGKSIPRDWVTVVTSNQVYLVNPSSLSRYTVKSDAFFEIALTLYKVLTTALPLECCIWQVMVNFTPYTAPVALFRKQLSLCMVSSRFGLTGNLCTYLQTEVGLLQIAGEKLSGRDMELLCPRCNLLRQTHIHCYRPRVKYGSSLWSGFRNYASLDALRLFSPANSKNLWLPQQRAWLRWEQNQFITTGQWSSCSSRQHAIGH